MKMAKDRNVTSSVTLYKTVTRSFRMYFSSVPVFFSVGTFGIDMAHGLSFAFITLMTQRFFDAVTTAVTSGGDMYSVLWPALALILTVIVSQLLNGVDNFIYDIIFEPIIDGRMQQQVNLKTARLAPVAFETPELLDLINKAQTGLGSAVRLVETAMSFSTFFVPYLLFMFVYLYTLEPVLTAALLLVCIPLVLARLARYYAFANLEDRVAPLRRERSYLRSCVGSKETRLLGAFPFFRALFADILQSINDGTWRAEKKAGLFELGANILTLLGYLGILGLFANALLSGRISAGAFAAVFASIDEMYSIVNGAIEHKASGFAQNLGAAKNFIRFLELPERGGAEQDKTGSAVKFRGVSFRYPNAAVDSIRDIQLEIGAGETVAIVGENGAGKSTLVKLALGLYTPTTGKVMQSGMDTQTASSGSLFRRVSAVFQNYQRYKMTLQDNVVISAPEEAGKEIAPLLAETGLPVTSEAFPQGEATMLSREFDGVELSGGQWQRIAISRGLYRGHDLIVLDEPTAAIDPVEESNLYRKFAEIAAGKTAIIVTHRLGSAKIADRIIVMDNGSIVESGTHGELLAQNGKYAAMYAAQAKWYM